MYAIGRRLTLTLTNTFQCYYCTFQKMKKFRVALVQSSVEKSREKNLERATNFIKICGDNGAKLVCLPECFNSPYGVQYFQEYAEQIPTGPTSKMLSNAAKSNKVFVIGGTFPEVENRKYYNTCTVWDPCGDLVAKFRKMHLFDIDIPGGITFKESEILSPGAELSTFKIDDFEIGLGVCYDLRFEELAKLYRLRGCKMIVYPAAFNMTTGPMHFELLQRGRALDNQLFIVAISPARAEKGYVAWGHSMITNPWGKIVAKAGSAEEIVYCDIDLSELETVRQQIPIGDQRRNDIYDTVLKKH